MDQPQTSPMEDRPHPRMRRADYRPRAGRPSRPLLGVLPLRRVIPQDVHSVMHYAAGLTLLTTGLWCRDRKARGVGQAIGAAVVATSLLTDRRLGLAKVIPIEVHEVADYLTATATMALPFAVAYRSRSARWVHFAVGLTNLAGSLFTDYRSQRGR